MEANLSDWACGGCGRVYNPVLRDRYWRGEWELDGEIVELLCDDCKTEAESAPDRPQPTA